MPNVKSIISKHNKTILDPPINTSGRTCSYINKERCMLLESRLTKSIVYKATLASNQYTYQTKYVTSSPKPTSTNDTQTIATSIKSTLNFQMNYVSSKLSKPTTALQISYGK